MVQNLYADKEGLALELKESNEIRASECAAMQKELRAVQRERQEAEKRLEVRTARFLDSSFRLKSKHAQQRRKQKSKLDEAEAALRNAQLRGEEKKRVAVMEAERKGEKRLRRLEMSKQRIVVSFIYSHLHSSNSSLTLSIILFSFSDKTQKYNKAKG